MAELAAQTGSPILSIAIPTRERCLYLRGAVITALACADSDVEVVVSDNASADDTQQVMRAFSDSRLVYVNTGSRVPMRENFELALSRSRGRYLLFMGDDDGVLPQGIARLLKILRSAKPDAVNWQSLYYEWPKDSALARGGQLLIKPRDMRGGARETDAHAMLADFGACRVKGYRDGANIYHGCVAREVVEHVKARTGEYFFAPWPDVCSSIANLFEASKVMTLGSPCSIGGVSPASTGASMRVQEQIAAGARNPLAAFAQENASRNSETVLDSRLRSLRAITYFTMRDAINRLGASDRMAIDVEKWRSTIEAETAALAEPARSEQADMTDAMFKAFGERTLDRRWPKTQSAKRPKSREPLAGHRLLPNRLSIASDPGFCDDVAAAARLADEIIGEVPETERRQGIGLATAWAGALYRAARAIARH